MKTYAPLSIAEDNERWTRSWYHAVGQGDKCMCDTCEPWNINPVDLDMRRVRATATWKWWQWWK